MRFFVGNPRTRITEIDFKLDNAKQNKETLAKRLEASASDEDVFNEILGDIEKASGAFFFFPFLSPRAICPVLSRLVGALVRGVDMPSIAHIQRHFLIKTLSAARIFPSKKKN